MTTTRTTLRRLMGMGLVVTLVLGAGRAQARHEPPPAVIPTAETKQADDLYKAGRYQDAVAAAKEALTKNERYTPAMLVMAKSFFKLHKYEWMKKLWEMMQANGASANEKAEIYQLLAFLEIDQKNVPGAIALLKQAAEAKPDDADRSGATWAPSTWRPRTTRKRRPSSRRRPLFNRASPRRTSTWATPSGATRTTKKLRRSISGPYSSSRIMPTRCSTSESFTWTPTRSRTWTSSRKRTPPSSICRSTSR